MSLNWPGYFKLTRMMQAVDQFRIFQKKTNARSDRAYYGKFNATRRAVVIVFSRMQKVFFDEFKCSPCAKQAVLFSSKLMVPNQKTISQIIILRSTVVVY